MQDSWTYKGQECEIVEDFEPDNVKIFHFVKTPEKKSYMACISPYNSFSRDLVNKWIDLGYPHRNFAPYSREEINTMWNEKFGTPKGVVTNG